VSERELSTDLFGGRIALPLAIAPTGLNGIFWNKADLRLASAASHANIPFIQSTLSNDSIDDVARIEGLRHWWQLYVFGERRSRASVQNSFCCSRSSEAKSSSGRQKGPASSAMTENPFSASRHAKVAPPAPAPMMRKSTASFSPYSRMGAQPPRENTSGALGNGNL
jgi:hypothetical protein